MTRQLNVAQTRLMRCVEARVPAIMIGSPGVGKSAMCREVAEMMGLAFIDLRLSIRESVDLRGNPVANHEAKTTEWYRPSELPLIGSGMPERGIIVLEEINACAPSVQVAAYQIADIRNPGIGEHRLMPGWYVCATGNKISDKAGAQRMNSALANRFAWIDCEVDVEAWSQWALTHGVDPLLVGFILYRPELLFKMAPDAREFPSPRSWENAGKFMKLARAERHGLIAACVSSGPASELEAYLDIVDELEPVTHILANPTTAKVPSPEKIGALYAVTMAVANAITKQTAKAGATYAMRLAPEFKALFAKTVLLRDKSLAAYGFASVLASGV